MKRLTLIVLLLLCAPLLRADEAPPTREQLKAQLQVDTAKVESLKKQTIPANDNEAEQKNYFETMRAYENRAATYEKLEDWKAAAWEWYLADFMRFKLFYGEYDAASNREAYQRANQADNQMKAGDWEGADRSMEGARRGKGWDTRSYFTCLVSARVNLLFNRPDEALADALDAKARAAKEGQSPRNAYIALSLAYYQKGDLENTRANWNEVLKIQKPFEVVKFFSAEGARLNASIAQNPKDAKSWLERGRYYQYFGDRYAKAGNKTAEEPGSWFVHSQNLAKFSSSEVFFWDAAQRDYTQSLKLARTPLALALRAQSLYKIQSAPADRKKDIFPPTQSWTEDAHSAFVLGAEDFDSMDALSELYQDEANKIAADKGQPGQRRAAQKQANFYASLALLHHPDDPLASTVEWLLKSEADRLINENDVAPKIEIHQTAEEWKNAGNEYHKKDDLYNALLSYKEALALDPKYADAQNNIGTVYEEVGDYRRSIEAFRAAIALDPQHRVAHNNLANVLKQMAFFPEALAAAEDAVKFATPQFKAGALDTRGDLRYLMNDRAGALSDWRAEVELDPKQAAAWRAIGKVSLGDADITGAREAFAKTLELQPEIVFNKILLASALNIAAFQDAAKAQGKTAKELSYSEWEKIRPDAAKLLQDVRLSNQAEREELSNLWDELFKGTAMDKDDANLPLAVSGKSVLNAAYGEKKQTFDGAE